MHSFHLKKIYNAFTNHCSFWYVNTLLCDLREQDFFQKLRDLFASKAPLVEFSSEGCRYLLRKERKSSFPPNGSVLDNHSDLSQVVHMKLRVGFVWTFYSHLPFLPSFSLSLGDSPIQTEILSQRAVKPRTTNQPINYVLLCLCYL